MFISIFAAGLHSIVLYGTELTTDTPVSPSSSVASTDLTLFIGLIVAFIIFLIVVICMVKILRKKNLPHPNYSLTPGGANPGLGGMYHSWINHLSAKIFLEFFKFLFLEKEKLTVSILMNFLMTSVRSCNVA